MEWIENLIKLGIVLKKLRQNLKAINKIVLIKTREAVIITRVMYITYLLPQ